VWKIADFGLTSAGTSKRAYTTIYSRGTCSYRAPELIADEKATYTNKVDIWAIGCILYELAFGKKAFSDDLAVCQYSLQWSASGEKMALPSTSDTIPHEGKMVFVSKIIRDTLTIDETRRPKAEDLHQRFIDWGSSESVSLLRDSESSSALPPTIEYVEDLPDGKIIL
jgi:serine/threonine protein kinase